MNGVERNTTGSVQVYACVTVTLTAGGTASLLPESPGAPQAADLDCAMGQLYELMAAQRSVHDAAATHSIDCREKEAKAALQREFDALQRAEAHEPESGRGFFSCIGKIVGDVADDLVHLRVSGAVEHLKANAEEAWNSPRFWAELERGAIVVAKVAAIVGSAVGTIATLGAAGPLLVAVVIGVALSGAAMVQDETHVLQKLGVSDDVAKWASIGCSIAGSVIVGGAGASAMLANAASKAATIGHAIQVTSSLVGASAQTVAAGAHVRSGDHAALAEEAQADRVEQQHVRSRLERMIRELVDCVKETDKSSQRSIEALQGAMHIHNQTLVLSTAKG